MYWVTVISGRLPAGNTLIFLYLDVAAGNAIISKSFGMYSTLPVNWMNIKRILHCSCQLRIHNFTRFHLLKASDSLIHFIHDTAQLEKVISSTCVNDTLTRISELVYYRLDLESILYSSFK